MKRTNNKNSKITLIIVLLIAAGLVFGWQRVRAIELEKLTISDLQIFNIAGDSATISWKTNRVADGLVEYGEKTNYTNYVKQTGPLDLYHEVTLGGLKQKTEYYFRVKSIDAYGNELTSFGHSLKTGTLVDKIHPIISNVKLQYVTDTTAVFTWDTNEYTSAVVYYGYESQGSNYKWQKGGSSGTEHLVIITGLKPMTYYNYDVRAKDKAGNWAISQGGKFSTTQTSTAKETELKILNLKPIAPGDTPIMHDTAIIEWQINKLANGQLSYGASERYGKTVKLSDYNTEFKVQLKSLQPSTTYHFQVSMKDIFGKSVKSNDMTFITKTAPEKLPELRLTEVKQAVIQHNYTRPTALYKTAGDPRVYAVFANKKYYISSPKLFSDYGYNWSNIQMVEQGLLNKTADIRLVKTPDSSAIYYLYLEKGIKKAINSPSVFNSYSDNKWEDIVTITTDDISRFKEARLVKTKLSPTVYYLDGNTKRPIKNIADFEKNNFRWEDICLINQADLDSYFSGDFLD